MKNTSRQPNIEFRRLIFLHVFLGLPVGKVAKFLGWTRERTRDEIVGNRLDVRADTRHMIEEFQAAAENARSLIEVRPHESRNARRKRCITVLRRSVHAGNLPWRDIDRLMDANTRDFPGSFDMMIVRQMRVS